MPRKRLLWKLFPAQLLITISALIVLTLFVSTAMQNFFLAETVTDLEARVSLVENDIKEFLGKDDLVSLNKFCRSVGQKASTRITVILDSGLVVADSREDPAKMDNHGSREEVIAALAGRTGTSIRYSKTLQQKMMYVAKPLNLNEVTTGSDMKANNVLRVSIPITSFEQTLKSLYGKIALGCLVIALITAIITLTVSRRLSRPLEAIKRSAERFGRGDFSHQLKDTEGKLSMSLEVGSLVDTMNRMAEQLNERITTAERQHQQLEAVFSSMIEAVIAIDSTEKVISLNQAAAELFMLESSEASGKKVEKIVGRGDILDFIKKTMAGYRTIEDELVFSDQNNITRYLQAHGTKLRNLGGQHFGALIVLNDITRLQKLEEVRRDFVANVSHELKTPITSIKGFVETLLDGALVDEQDVKRFLEIINKQADRLSRIVEDLLMLSHLEQEGKDKIELAFNREELREILQSSLEVCTVGAEEKNIEIVLVCPEDIHVSMNAPLFEQAIVNLVVNGIKYSEENNEVHITARRENGETVILVKDFGVGIADEHLPRLFERFYRSDKARSRKLGGTGLGLAIVKHIVQIHDGTVTVESRLGEGTVFTIRLPEIRMA